MTEREPIGATLIVLTGGRGTRMGTRKHRLWVDGETLLERAQRVMAPHFDDVVIVGAEGIADERAGFGPLAGIETGLKNARHPRAFVMACDMPHVTPSLAHFLLAQLDGIDAVVPRADGRAELLCAAYAREALRVITACLDRGDRQAALAVAAMRARYIEAAELAARGFPMSVFANLNTPDDVASLLADLL